MSKFKHEFKNLCKSGPRFVGDGSSMSMHSLIRNVGQGPNRHDFVGEVLIILSTASSENCLKTVIFEGSEGG